MSSPTPRWRDGEAPKAPVFTGTQRFALRRTLGEGGMGVVYEAWDHERGMAVALKTLRHLDAQNLFRLKSEFRTHADIEHRNLVRLGELMHEGGFWFFTMELVDGRGFREWITGDPDADVIDTSQEIALGPQGPTTRAYDERRLRSALRQLASGLDALHHAGKVHRDLKPSNVMVTTKDRLVILDLGLAVDMVPRDASDKAAVGTAAYVAPEQAMGDGASPASDWYSVGVMLYEVLTGALPVDGSPLEILLKKQTYTPNPAALADAPPDLAQLCIDLLATEPKERPDGNAILARLAAPRARATTEDGVAKSSPFVGRRPELEALSHALSDVDGGAAVTVRIEGASGIGKSALVRHFLDNVVRQRPGAIVLSGRCHERETVPFKGLDGVVDAIARAMVRLELGDSVLPHAAETAALAQVFPVLLRVPAIARMSATLPENPFELRARAYRGLRMLLRKLALRRLVVITIDDVQWADADTLSLVREILHAPGMPRILTVVTWRGDAPPSLPGPVRVIELDRLSQAEAEGLVALVAPDRVADAAALAAAADGHPMFLRELLRHAAPPRQARLDDALWARIARMDISARRILELVSVAGRPLPQNLVIDALGIDPRTSAKWLAVLRAASLVRTGGARGSDPVEPYHDRVRAAVVARVAPARRRRYHARLAAALTANGLVDKDPLAVVKHLENAGMRAQAGDLARRAARRSSSRAPAFEQIAALCDAAIRLGADQGDRDIRRELLVERAEALACAGRGPEAAAAYLRAADELDGDDGFHCHRSAAEQLLVSGHTEEGMRRLRELTGAVGISWPRSTAAAKRKLLMHTLWHVVRGIDFKVKALADPGLLRRYEVFRAASLGLGMVDPVIGAAYCAEGLRCAIRIGDPRRVTYALAYHAMYVAAGGDRYIERARSMVVRARALATECRSRMLLAIARASEGIVEYFAGNLIQAIDVMVDAEEQLRNHTYGTAGELNHLRMFLLFAMRRHGGFNELRPRYDEYVRDALRRGDRYAGTTFRWSANVVWLAADDVERAHTELEAASWDELKRLHLQHWFHARAVTELALYEGADDRLASAEAELRRFLGGVMDHVQIVRVETSIELARICIRRRDAAGARVHLARIAKDKSTFLRAIAELLEAACSVLDGDRAGAREHLDAAIRHAAFELPVIGALARRRLGELTEGSSGARLIAEADAVLLHHGVSAPAKFAQVFATWPS